MRLVGRQVELIDKTRAWERGRVPDVDPGRASHGGPGKIPTLLEPDMHASTAFPSLAPSCYGLMA